MRGLWDSINLELNRINLWQAYNGTLSPNHKNYIMSLLTIVLNILLPPLAVFLKHGVGSALLISILLTLLAWLPGVIHAFIVNG